MTKIICHFDTHSNDILKDLRQADEVWHAGDKCSVEVTETIKAIFKINIK